MRRVIVLRPEPGASETVERARALGLDAVAIPLFAVEPLAWEAPDANAFDALLLTSANAVRHGGPELRKLRDLPVHAVGRATAETAREAGFTLASIGDEGVDRLLGAIGPDVRLLHLCGENPRQPADPRQQITTVPVYRARPLEASASLSQAEGAVVLVHSPRAGERLAELVAQLALDRSTIAIAAISPAAVAAVGLGWADVESAAAPSDDELLALAQRLCDKPAAK